MSQDKSITENELALDVEQLLEEYDADASKSRKLTGLVGKATVLVAILMSLFHLYTAGAGVLLSARQRSLHIIFAFTLGFLLFPATKKSDKSKPSILDYILIVTNIIIFGYLFVYVEEIAFKGGNVTTIDVLFGGIAILLTLEITRRVVGPELPIVAILFLLYARFGPYLPGVLGHRGFTWDRIINHMYLTLEGILGIPISVSSTFVFMFILFGTFLDKTGVGEFFIDMAYSLTGHLKSGPAMTAVVASGFMGSVSGSSVANTVTTGAFTIPLMKDTGYKPYFAGAVEAAASTGGQIMPPVMGAAAFIMAEFTGIPYIKIIAAAAIPAILYYFAVGTMVHLEASKLGLKGIPKDELPKFSNIMKTKGYLLIPLFVIVYFLIKGYTPLLSAFWAIAVSVGIAIIATLIKKDESFTVKKFFSALEQGAKSSIGVVCACACAGMVVGVVTLTGLGLRIAELIITLAQGKLFLTLFFTMIASIILGMGLPTTAKYIVLATMAVPALIKLDVNLMSAHLFILYFGVVADITPPVALAAYAGAGIAGANAMKTGFQAVKLALAAFIVPYIFAYDSSLILVKEVVGGDVVFLPFIKALPMILSAIIGILCLACAVEGYLISKCRIYERILLFAAAISLLKPGIITDVFGIVVLLGIYLIQRTRKKDEVVEPI
ncbi:MAG: TRAP transporter permease [Tissierellia bacterium]|nr:TRAP transporter permease [Tissierellia bacterium]